MFRKIRREPRRSVGCARAGTRSLSGRAGARRHGALQPQARDRADGLDQHHLRRHQRVHRADPGQYLHAQDAVWRVLGAQSASRKTARAKGADTPDVWQSIIEHEGSVQHLDVLTERGKGDRSAPPSRSTSAGSSNSPPTARRSSARASRSISICPPTSINGTCTCCTGRHGSAA